MKIHGVRFLVVLLGAAAAAAAYQAPDLAAALSVGWMAAAGTVSRLHAKCQRETSGSPVHSGRSSMMRCSYVWSEAVTSPSGWSPTYLVMQKGTVTDTERSGMERVFVSYRSGDASAEAMLVKERIDHVFGPRTAFLDHRSIELGTDFQERLWTTLRGCDASIVVIGPQWFAADPAGVRKVDRQNDFVRREIEVALARHRVVIPVLVREARTLTTDLLPHTIRALARRQYVRIDHRSEDAGLRDVVERLTDVLGDPPDSAGASGGAAHAGAIFNIGRVGKDFVNGPKTENHYGR